MGVYRCDNPINGKFGKHRPVRPLHDSHGQEHGGTGLESLVHRKLTDVASLLY